MQLRPATHEDLPALLDLHNTAVRELRAIWTDRLETLEDRKKWLEGRQAAGLPVIVAIDEDGGLLGYASYGPFRAKEGYNLTMEHSIYVSKAAQGKGTGKALLAELIERAKAAGLHTLVGAVDADNAASLALHARFGFTETGRLPQVGFKFGQWMDLIFVVKVLSDTAAPPAGSAV